jgi:hypothetical protein
MRFIRTTIVVGLLILLNCSCAREVPPPAPNDLTVTLRWIKGYPGDTKKKVEVGLMWALSFLGAEFPDSSPTAFIWHGNLVTVDLERVGIAATARPAWEKAVAAVKRTDEYRRTGGMDIGRFLMLTWCSPNAYYALTGVAPNAAEVRKAHSFESKQMAVMQSGIARGNRLVEVGEASKLPDIAFIGYEGVGDIQKGTFEKREVEVLDFMKNGQLRFALYDLDGNLKEHATSALTEAGKPSKCLWCHEIRLQPPRRNVTDVSGYLTTREFSAIVDERMNVVDRYRSGLHSKVDFRRTQDHTYAELLYLTFMEPSVERLAIEWNMPVEQVASLLRGKETHAQKEFAYLGSALYRREDIDTLAPYPVLRVAEDPREPSSYEPNLLHEAE